MFNCILLSTCTTCFTCLGTCLQLRQLLRYLYVGSRPNPGPMTITCFDCKMLFTLEVLFVFKYGKTIKSGLYALTIGAASSVVNTKAMSAPVCKMQKNMRHLQNHLNHQLSIFGLRQTSSSLPIVE